MLPGSSFADNRAVFRATGSSAMFNQAREAARTIAGGGAIVLAGRGAVVDTSSTGIPNEAGDLWVVFQGTPGNYQIWYFLSVDSTVGVRAFFNGTSLTVSSLENRDPNQTVSAATITEVRTAIQGTAFNAGMSDVTAVDAKVATSRAIQLGYNLSTGNRGYTTTSVNGSGASGAASTGSVFPVDFSLSARPFSLVSIGAAPILVFVNKSDATSGGLGDSLLTNVTSQQMALFADGTLSRTKDLILGLAPADSKPMATFLRELLSGTYITFEWCVPRSVRLGTSQERGTNASLNNPLNTANWIGNVTVTGVPPNQTIGYSGSFSQGGRVRGRGTSSILTWVNATPNSLGYSFWSTGNFNASSQPNTKYLTVDGVEPLLDSYQGGVYPSGASVTFRNIKNGTYPIWSVLRAVVDQSPTPEVQAMLDEISRSGQGGNVVPRNELPVFRSHRVAPPFAGVASNGNNVANGGLGEQGADAGGLVFPVEADRSFFADTGLELINLRQ